MAVQQHDVLRCAEEGRIQSLPSPTETVLTDSTLVCGHPEKVVLSKEASKQDEGASQSKRGAFFWLTELLSTPERNKDPFVMPSPKIRSLGENRYGYPALATYKDSSENFMLFRRFGYVSTRLLLDLQDDLRILEQRLDRMDKDDQDNDIERILTRQLPEEDGRPRKDLLKEIKEKYCEYADVLTSAQQIMAFNRPSQKEYESVVYHIEDEQLIAEEEASYVLHKQDLVTLRPGREHAWLDRCIESVLHAVPFLHPLFCSKETRQKGSLDGKVRYYTRTRIEALANAIITMWVLGLLIIPIYLLYRLVNGAPNGVMSNSENAVCMGILLISTLLFSAVLSLFTRARRHEILGAAAGYCAVLVVFLGNVRPSSI